MDATLSVIGNVELPAFVAAVSPMISPWRTLGESKASEQNYAAIVFNQLVSTGIRCIVGHLQAGSVALKTTGEASGDQQSADRADDKQRALGRQQGVAVAAGFVGRTCRSASTSGCQTP